MEIYFKLTDSTQDLLNTIDDAKEYLKTIAPDHHLSKMISKYLQYIDLRGNQIKENYTVRTLFNEITKIGSGDWKRKQAIDQQVESLLVTINSATVTEDFLTAVMQLKRTTP